MIVELLYAALYLQHWTKLDVSGPKPPARSRHAACYIAGPLTGQEHPLLLVAGGLGDDYKVLQDMWILDINGRKWKQVRLVSEWLECMLLSK